MLKFVSRVFVPAAAAAAAARIRARPTDRDRSVFGFCRMKINESEYRLVPVHTQLTIKMVEFAEATNGPLYEASANTNIAPETSSVLRE